MKRLAHILAGLAGLFAIATPLVAEEVAFPSIVGGRAAPLNEYPWMVALVRTDRDSLHDGQFCGGVLIAPTWILTAVHCVDDEDFFSFQIAVGNGDLTSEHRLFRPKAIYRHPESHPTRVTRGLDIALIQLSEPIWDVEPIALNRALDLIRPGKPAKAIGWGQTQLNSDEDTTPIRLQEVDLSVSLIEGPDDNHPVYDYYLLTSDNSPLRGIESGDSGGPLIVKIPDTGEWAVAGVSSFGGGSVEQNLIRSNFANVAVAADWIQDTIQPDISLVEPSKSPIDRVGPFRAGNPTPEGSFLIWPFAENQPVERLFNGLGNTFATASFSLEDTDRFEYAGNGAFYLYVYRPSLPARNLLDPVSFGRFGTDSRQLTYNAAPAPLVPFRAVNTMPFGWLRSYGFSSSVAIAKNLNPNFEYTITGSTSSLLSIFEVSDDKFEPIFNGYLFRPFDFKPKAGYEYWVSKQNDLTELYLRPKVAKSIRSNQTVAGQLTTASHPFTSNATRVEVLTPQSISGSGEYRIEVYSEFDVEIATYDWGGRLTAYDDIASEAEIDELIVSAETLQNSDILLFNFDKDATGSYTAKIEPFTNEDLRFTIEQRRAITSADESWNDNGQQVYYESLKIQNNQFKYLKIELNAHYFDPVVAIYANGNDPVEVQGGEEDYLIEIEALSNQEYEILVVDRRGPKNGNFEIKVTGSRTPTLSDEEVPPTRTFSRSPDKRRVETWLDRRKKPTREELMELLRSRPRQVD